MMTKRGREEEIFQETQEEALLNGPWSSPLATGQQTIAAEQERCRECFSLSGVCRCCYPPLVLLQVVMAVAQLYHHVGPRNEVGLIARPLIRLLKGPW